MHETLRGQCRSLAARYPDAALFVKVGTRYERPGRNHGDTTPITRQKLNRCLKERLAAGISVVIARETGRRYGLLLERLPALTIIPNAPTHATHHS